MNDISPNIADQINRWHDLAVEHADKAIEHARRAGLLLLQVKAELKHGHFLPWVEKNVHVTARQVQRYMAAAQGKPAVRAVKNDKPSHLTATAENGWTPRPQFTPLAGYWYWGGAGDRAAYVVEPSSAHPGFFFVTYIHPDGETYDCTGRPVAAAWVESNLQTMGLANPGAARWMVRPSAGVRIAMETLNSEETTHAMLARKETIEEAIERMKRAAAIGLPSQADGTCHR